MREDEIKKAVALLSSEKLSKVSEEQRNQFLKDKFSEEEISEIHKRLKQAKDLGVGGAEVPRAVKPTNGAPVIQNSPQAEQRLQQTNSHFLTNALNVASLAVVTSVGVTYLLDKFKDKKDETLRNELKDRLYSTLSENTNRLRQLEIRQDELVSHLNFICLIQPLLICKMQSGAKTS